MGGKCGLNSMVYGHWDEIFDTLALAEDHSDDDQPDEPNQTGSDFWFSWISLFLQFFKF